MKNKIKKPLAMIVGTSLFLNFYICEASPLRILMKEVVQEAGVFSTRSPFFRNASVLEQKRFFSKTQKLSLPENPRPINPAQKTVRILSIDGGGIRGILPLKILERLEKDLGKRTYQLFDIVSGASTGGIISLCLTAPNPAPHPVNGGGSLFSASELLNLYTGPERTNIFRQFDMNETQTNTNEERDYRRKHFRASLMETLQGNLDKSLETYFQKTLYKEILNNYSTSHKVKGVLLKLLLNPDPYLKMNLRDFLDENILRHLESLLGNYFHPKYRGDILRQTLINKGLNRQLLSDALTTVLVPSFSLTNYRNHIFKSTERNNLYYMTDVAMATSAAPTYFDPFGIKTVHRDFIHHGPDNAQAYRGPSITEPVLNICIDGGIALNNPTLLAYIEARKLFPEANHFLIVSLGTGSPLDGRERAPERDGGLVGIAKNYDIVNDSQIGAVEQNLEEVFKMDKDLGINVDYYRIQTSLDRRLSELDDISAEAVYYLESLGTALVERESIKTGIISRIVNTLGIERNYEARTETGEFQENKLITTLKPGIHLTKTLTMRLEEARQLYEREKNSLQNTIEERNESITRMQTSIKNKDDLIRERDDLIREQNKEITRMRTLMRNKDDLIREKDNEIERRNCSRAAFISSLKTILDTTPPGIFENKTHRELQAFIDRQKNNPT